MEGLSDVTSDGSWSLTCGVSAVDLCGATACSTPEVGCGTVGCFGATVFSIVGVGCSGDSGCCRWIFGGAGV